MRSSVAYNLCLLWTNMTCCMQFTCFIISILLVFGSNNQRRTTAEKLEVWNVFSPWHACLLEYTRPREPTNERRSHQNAGFSIWVFKKFPGVTPRTPTAGGGDPLPHPPPARPRSGRARGASAPVLGPKPWPPSTFQPWLRPVACVLSIDTAHRQKQTLSRVLFCFCFQTEQTLFSVASIRYLN